MTLLSPFGWCVLAIGLLSLLGLPIGYALGYPDRIGSPFGRIDWSVLSRLDFEPPDRATFRCLDLAYQAGRAGGTAPAWLSAANEIAVDAFLAGTFRRNEIPDVCVGVLAMHDGATPHTVDDVIDHMLPDNWRNQEPVATAGGPGVT